MFENNLKICRETLEMTQKELGEVFGITRKTISGWENNNDIIPLPKLIQFCNLYDFSVDYVIGLTRIDEKLNEKIEIDPIVVGKNLKRIRKELKMTQNDIAKECAISNTTYSNYELGINLISTITLYTICKKHGVSANVILKKDRIY